MEHSGPSVFEPVWSTNYHGAWLIFRDFQHIQILAAESGDLYMISA
eukprot:COSAG06_NODE_53557_length_299_cov_1.025000_1_plen_45_part_10